MCRIAFFVMAVLVFSPVVSIESESFVSNDSTSIGWDDVPSTKITSSTSGNILSFPLIRVNPSLVIVAAKE